MFGFRLFIIESTFFSYYQSYDNNWKPRDTISPLINDDGLRIIVYFLPSMIPMMTNIYRLKSTHGNFLKLCFQYPQLMLIPGFAPFMYEADIEEAEEDKRYSTVKVWKKGTIINAMYSFFIAPLALIISDCARGSVSWDNTPSATVPHRYTNSIIKHQFGNIGFSVASIILGLITIVLLGARFCDNKNRGNDILTGSKEIENETVYDDLKISASNFEIAEIKVKDSSFISIQSTDSPTGPSKLTGLEEVTNDGLKKLKPIKPVSFCSFFAHIHYKTVSFQ